MVRSLLLALVFSALLAPAAQAACTNTYSGPVGGEWQVDANWSLGHMPTATEDVCVDRHVVIVERGIARGKVVTIAAGAQVTMRTDPGFFHTQASFSEVDNAGTYEFLATGVAADNDVNELVVGTFTNRGTLLLAQSEGYTTIAGDVTNTGTITANNNLLLNGNGALATWRNSGTITVASGRTVASNSGWGVDFRQTAGTLTNNGALNFFGNASDVLTVSGGTFTGNPPTLRQGSLALTGGTGVARIQYGQVSLATDVAPGWTIRIEDRGSDVTRLRIPAGATRTNTGTIVFAADPVPGSNERVRLGDRHPRRGRAGQHRHDPRRRRRRSGRRASTPSTRAGRATGTRPLSSRTGRSTSVTGCPPRRSRSAAARRPWPPVSG